MAGNDGWEEAAPEEAAVALRSVGGVAPVSAPAIETANNVMAYRGPSKMTKGGEISMRTNPAIKTMAGIGFENQIGNMNRVIDMLDQGMETGPGTGVLSMIDKAAVGLKTITGYGLPGVDEAKAERRVTSRALLEKTGIIAAIEALAGIGGNDTDRDFDRALNTTVSLAKTRGFNKETAMLTRDMLDLGRKKRDFFTKFANQAGSPLSTINGVGVEEAWGAYAEPIQRSIIKRSQQMSGTENVGPRKMAARPGETAAPPQVRTDAKGKFRIVAGPGGATYKQYMNGSLVKAN